MNQPNACEVLSWKQTVLYSLGAIASFHLAYSFPQCAFLIVVYLFCLFRLANLNTPRKAFFIGFAIGMAIFAPQLGFLWNIFKAAAIALWAVLAFWIGFFLLLAHVARKRLGEVTFAILIPFLWTGLEFFRSELYYLRFSWLNVGYVFSTFSDTLGLFGFFKLGVYGIGFVLMGIIAYLSLFRRKVSCALITIFIALFGIFLNRLHVAPKVWGLVDATNHVSVAGIQMEFSPEAGVVLALDKLVKEQPGAELLVLSEYTFDGPVPDKVKAWCKTNQKYLVVGGKHPLPNDNFFNTAFVIGPTGEIVFQQAKSVPIQFFKDGLPATEQKLWDSPWGKIGICICYDLSYRRVVDELVRQGAEALVVPMMDVADWGKHQHELHSRIPPARAAEYGIPIFRVASSGISQMVTAQGWVQATAPFPGEEKIIVGTLLFMGKGSLPMDHWLAPLSVGVTGLVIVFLGISAFTQKRRLKVSAIEQPETKGAM